MENPITLSFLNDFIFCPVSIYFHNLYYGVETTVYQGTKQIDGTLSHKTVDENLYSKPDVLKGISVFSEKYSILGKIDTFYVKKGILMERKKKVSKIYDGYVFQVYAQCFSLMEMGYDVKKIVIHSIDDNKNYEIPLPQKDIKKWQEFEELVHDIETFDMASFVQTNEQKCRSCIYHLYCDRSLFDDF